MNKPQNITFLFKFIIAFVTTIGSLQSCHQQTCDDIPKTFTSYSEAKNIVKKAKFQYTDYIEPKSSWISSASYYSCDGKNGFFEMITNKGNDYLFKDMPLDIWEGFKNATSKGKYYHKHIRGNYQLKTNQ